MTTIAYRLVGDGLEQLTRAMASLSNDGERRKVLRRAVNHTGDKAFTRVKKDLSQQIKAPQAAIVEYGKVRRARANAAGLEYQIIGSGGPIPLKHFKPAQTQRGVSAAPWGNRKVYKGSFFAAAAGGHVFWRKGKARLPIERIAGPNVPKEMVKDQVAAAFQSGVATNLPPRVVHEIRVLTNGVVS